MALSVVALVMAGVAPTGVAVAEQADDATAALTDSTPVRPDPSALNGTDDGTNGSTDELLTTIVSDSNLATNETTENETNTTNETTRLDSGINRTTENETTRNNTTRTSKKKRTINDTNETSQIESVTESSDTGSTSTSESPSDSTDSKDTDPSSVTDPPDTASSELKVSVSQRELESIDATVRNVVVRNAKAHQSVSVDVSPPESQTSVVFDALEVTPTTNTSFDLNVTVSENPITGKTPTANLSNGTEPLAFVSVDHSITDQNISNVTFRFRVRKERVNASELDEISLYRYHDGSWNELPTKMVNVTDTHFVYRVRSPGLSEFAAGKQTPQFEITNASFEFATLSVGDSLEVRVRITNEGDADGTFEADLVIDSETVASRRLTIAADGMRQTTFERRVAESGTYEVYVNDFRVGEVTVNETVAVGDPTRAGGTQSTDAGESASTNETPATDEQTDSGTTAGLPGFGLWVALGSLVAALVVVRRLEEASS